MNTMVKGLTYTEQGTTAWNNELKQLDKEALHLGERLDILYVPQPTFWHVNAF